MRKIISVLLAVILMLSLIPIAASAESVVCDIRVKIDGGGMVSDGEHSTYMEMTLQYYRGDPITLTAMPDVAPDGTAESKFLYWKNEETRRILSFDTTYSFSVATYQNLVAVFDVSDEIAAEEGKHRVIYLSAGNNQLYTEYLDVGDDTYIENVMPEERLFVGGMTWLGWDHTPQQVAADPGTVYVRPLYSNEASHIITSIVDGEATRQIVKYGATAVVQCPPSLNGVPFSYWVERGQDEFHTDEVAGYFVRYAFIAVKDVTLEAVYGDGNASGVAIRVVGDTPDFENHAIRFDVERSVTSSYTVMQTGILLTLNVRIGSSESAFVINPNEPDIKRGQSTSTASAGTYSPALGKWYATTPDGINYYPLVFARGYVVVKDAQGNTQTYYSSIYCADYISESFIGSIEGDNFPDPF